MTLTLAGVTALFLGFTGAYLYNRIQQGVPPVRLPWLFYANTAVLLASSYTMIKAKKAYKDDDTDAYKVMLMVTLGLTLLFLLAQILAWKQMISDDVLINHSTMASYMYLISGLHLVHVVAGIPFLVVFIVIAYREMKSPMSVLLYFSDPAKKRKLDALNIYWHFLDGLWVYLVVFFLVNYVV